LDEDTPNYQRRLGGLPPTQQQQQADHPTGVKHICLPGGEQEAARGSVCACRRRVTLLLLGPASAP